MIGDVLTARVREFLRIHVPHVDALQVLLLLIDGGHRWWDADDVGIRTGIEPAVVAKSLEGFAAQNLLDIRISDAVRYRVHAGSPELARGLDLLAAAYRKSPTAVVSFVAGMDRALMETGSSRLKR
jgi:hypothetical protein